MRTPPEITDRDFVADAEKKHRQKVIALIASFLVLLLGSVIVFFEIPEVLFLMVLAACLLVTITLVTLRWETSRRTVEVFLMAAVTANCVMAYMVVNSTIFAAFIGLAGVIFASGTIGLLTYSRARESPPSIVKAMLMVLVAAIFVVSMVAYTFEPTGNALDYARIWFMASITPMIYMVVMTPLVLLAYHKDYASMPADRWV